MNVKIPDYIIKQYKLPNGIKGKFESVAADKLLCPQRLDIAAKFLYLKLKDILPERACKIYSEHIRLMTKGSYIEPYSNKSNIEDFIRNFDELFDNLKNKGYDLQNVVPVDKNYKILDGAHRVASCLFLGIDVPIVIVPIEGKYDNYDQNFFEEGGFENGLLDEVVFTYITLSKKSLCVNLWPSAIGHDLEFFELINKYFFVVYRKDLQINETGAIYYLAQIYSEYSWAKNIENGLSDIYRKLMPCFPTFDPVRAIFVEKKYDFDLAIIKEKMRNIFQIGKHSLHITDNQSETVQMGKIILNNNSINFLNHSNILAFDNTFSLVKEAIRKSNSQPQIVFTGSVVLALYGIRAAEDLDYISENNEDKNSHNCLIKYYGHGVEEILYDPTLTFSFFNCRYLTLDVIRQFKIRRNEEKDKDDIQLINLIKEKGGGTSFRASYLRIKRRIVARIQGLIIRVAHKTGTYDLLRNFYKTIKR